MTWHRPQMARVARTGMDVAQSIRDAIRDARALDARSYANTIFRLRFTLALLVASLAGFLVHEAFHFADWLGWGLGWSGLRPVVDALWPAFGAHDLAGYAAHAIVNALVLLALFMALGALWGSYRFVIRS